MEGGKLRHLIQLQTVTQTADATGQRIETWVNGPTVWASIEPASSREQFINAQMKIYVTHKITMRYISGVDGTMRATYNGRVFNFQGNPLNFEERNIYLVIMAVESA